MGVGPKGECSHWETFISSECYSWFVVSPKKEAIKPVLLALTSQSETVNVGAGAQSDSILNDMKFQEWLDIKYSPYTVMNTRRALRHLENEGVDLWDRHSFQAWVAQKNRKKVHHSTLNDYIKPYNRILKYQSQWPMIELFKTSKPHPPRATIDDYDRLVAACHGYTSERDALIVDMSFKMGFRVGDAYGLTLEDVRQGRDWIRVRGKGDKVAVVYAPASIMKGSLPRYLAVRRAEKGVNALFVTKDGKPFAYNGFRRVIYELAQRAGIRFSMHMGRRFYPRWLSKEFAMNIENISQAMRHESIEITKQYMQLDQADMFEAFRSKKPDFKRHGRK